MFQQNPSILFFVCVTNSPNIIPFFHENIISHDSLQKFIQVWPERVKTNSMRIKQSSSS